MPEPLNPFPPSDADRHAIWDMLMKRDFDAFVAKDWSQVRDDFDSESFFAVDCRHQDDPREWRLTFPGLEAYRDAWLRQAEEFSSTELVTMGRLEFLYQVSEIRDIDIVEDRAIAHKRFSGSANATDGRQIHLRWQTLYHCRRMGGRWRIVGFTGYLPINA